MSAINKLLLVLDNGTIVRVPPPPASTGGADYALLDTDGVLHWGAVTAPTDILIDRASGDPEVDRTSGDVLTER